MGWIIFIGILLFFIFLFSRFIVISIQINDDVTLKLKYLFLSFQLLPQNDEKEKKKEKRKKPKKKAENIVSQNHQEVKDNRDITNSVNDKDFEASQKEIKHFENNNTNKTDKTESSKKNDFKGKKLSFDEKLKLLSKKYNQIKEIIDSAKNPLLKFIKRIHIKIKALNIIVGGSDAYSTAMSFGSFNMIIGNILGWVAATMNLSTDSDRIEVNADFDLKKTKYDVDFYVKVRVFTVIALAISFVINYIKNINKTAVPTKARKEVKNG
ncbi:MAG: DUF2953 domain-containing protein [Clostridiales bacterium]|nr:DUF2953 domain-containing protein [Clostridiales bacterium]